MQPYTVNPDGSVVISGKLLPAFPDAYLIPGTPAQGVPLYSSTPDFSDAYSQSILRGEVLTGMLGLDDKGNLTLPSHAESSVAGTTTGHIGIAIAVLAAALAFGGQHG